MIFQESIEAVERSVFSKSFGKPLYDCLCFSKIPATVCSLLGVDQGKGLPSGCVQPDSYDAVVFLFLDGFAWRYFERYKDHPFLRRFSDGGVVSKITAQFPSTTAAEVTTIHTGLEVGQTGIYEWFQYEPQVDRIIAPLLFSYAGDKVAESLSSCEVPPAEFFPFETIYQKLQDHKISSHLVQPVQLATSPYSQRMGRGAHVLSYFTLQQGIQGIKETLNKQSDQKAYIMLYYPDIDAVGHRKGPGSKELEEEVLRTLDLLERELMSSLSLQGKKVALMLSADHGMVAVDPKNTWYVNKEYPGITSLCKKSSEGYLLAPAGSCRDLFLHIKEEAIEEVFETLTDRLQGRAEVWKTAKLITAGLFGSHVSSRFLHRVGDLVVLPYEGEAVWWQEKHRFEQHFYGAHGGLTRGELEIPFLFARI